MSPVFLQWLDVVQFSQECSKVKLVLSVSVAQPEQNAIILHGFLSQFIIMF